MATQPASSLRDMNLIAQDLHSTRMRFYSLQADCIGRDPTPAEHNRWDDFERREASLKSEFCETLHALTGLTWTRACNAMDVA